MRTLQSLCNAISENHKYDVTKEDVKIVQDFISSTDINLLTTVLTSPQLNSYADKYPNTVCTVEDDTQYIISTVIGVLKEPSKLDSYPDGESDVEHYTFWSIVCYLTAWQTDNS